MADITLKTPPQQSPESLDLRAYDWVVISSSAGKDSQAMLTRVAEQAKQQGVLDRIVVVHADLGRVEWAGTRELAEEQARFYGLRFEVVRNENWRDLLHRVEGRGKWMSYGPARYCTAEFKRNPIKTLFTRLAKETREARDGNANTSSYRVRILSCLGIRAAESDERSKQAPFTVDMETTTSKAGKVDRNSRRQVDEWFPVFNWSAARVWATIRASGVPHHPAYDLGMERLSCVFCFYAGEKALLLSGYHNRQLLAEYVEVEQRIGHTFKHHEPLFNIQSKLEAGYVPTGPVAFDAPCAA